MRNQKGITLIALIVTIIVLIIIAGISIATLTADNGILRQVDSAKVETIEGTAREEVTLAMGALRIAIAQAQAEDNSYKANTKAGSIQLAMLQILNADTKLSDKNTGYANLEIDNTTGTLKSGVYPTTVGGWTTTFDAQNKAVNATNKADAASTITFDIQYTGDDYQNACNNDNSKIVYTISLAQSSIEYVNIQADGITSGSGTNAIKPTDIGANALKNGF